MILFLNLIISIYTLVVGAFIFGFYRLKKFNWNTITPKNTFSILVPFRNEGANLPKLLESISNINYPTELFEIILINDDSEDDFQDIIQIFTQQNKQIDIKLIDNLRISNSPKKDAIQTGIQNSKFDWILTTDADCIVPILWMQAYDAYIQKYHPYFIAGPVSFIKSSSLLGYFQTLDFSALIGSTIGSFGIKKPFMCNGANLCYRKDIFNSLNGFEGNNNIASGDDIFLLEKMNTAFPDKTKYLKSRDGLVLTKPETTLTNLLNQRIRWASKATSYSNTFSKLVSMVVLLTNLAFIILLIKVVVATHHSKINVSLLILKILIDFWIITSTLSLFKDRKTLLYYPLIAFLHPIFIVTTAFTSLFYGNYSWKKRSFSTKNR